jgi:polyisoprenoid-binding protein YceI
MTDPSHGHVQSLVDLLENGSIAGTWNLDPQQSRMDFAVKHFWGAVTVRGSFTVLRGEAVVSADGTVTGELSADATSLNTKNKKRDEHLRSSDFFHTERHRHVAIAVTAAQPTGPDAVSFRGTLDAAGHVQPIEFVAYVGEASPQAITLRTDLTVDRNVFGMTWSPLGMASKAATGTAVTRWVRA